ncbi:MAG TPA: PH domain-containing protein [Acidimicrobiia bacterium]
MRREAVRLKLGESRLRIALSVATPPLLVFLAWGSWAVDAPSLVTWVLVVLIVLLGYVVAFDFALAIEVDANGIHRRCLLRRQLIPWGEIAGIVQPGRRGLVVVTDNRKRHVLLDRRLEEGERDLLRAQAQLRDVKVGF